MRKLFRHPWGWASAAPLACALHCAATPLLVVAAPALAPGERLEVALLGMTVVVGGSALAAGVRRHGRLAPALPVLVGMVAWTASLLHLFHPVPEDLTTVAATLVVAAGLIWNARIRCAADGIEAEPCATCAGEAIPPRGIAPARGAAPSEAGPGPVP